MAAGTSVDLTVSDIGNKGLENVAHKMYQTASAEGRARRRFLELEKKGKPVAYEQLLSEINQRDWDDSHRAASPLCKAEDAIEVDSSAMTQEEVTGKILALAKERM